MHSPGRQRWLESLCVGRSTPHHSCLRTIWRFNQFEIRNPLKFKYLAHQLQSWRDSVAKITCAPSPCFARISRCAAARRGACQAAVVQSRAVAPPTQRRRAAEEGVRRRGAKGWPASRFASSRRNGQIVDLRRSQISDSFHHAFPPTCDVGAPRAARHARPCTAYPHCAYSVGGWRAPPSPCKCAISPQ